MIMVNVNQAYEGEELQEPCEVGTVFTQNQGVDNSNSGASGQVERRRRWLPSEVRSRDLLLQTLPTVPHPAQIQLLRFALIKLRDCVVFVWQGREAFIGSKF